MMLFVSDVVDDLRLAIVAYRDRKDEFETKAWEFTDSLEQARSQLRNRPFSEERSWKESFSSSSDRKLWVRSSASWGGTRW